MCCAMLICFSHVWLFGTLWTVAHQAPLSMGFSRQENWSGLPYSPPGDLSNQGIKPMSVTSPTWAGGFFTSSATWEGPLFLFNINWIVPSQPKWKMYWTHCVPLHVCVLSRVWLFVTPWTVAWTVLCPWDFPGKNTGVGFHFLLQGIFPIRGSNLHLCVSCIGRWILYH